MKKQANKWLSLLLAAVLALSSIPAHTALYALAGTADGAAAQTGGVSYKPGDVDGNGEITSADARFALRRAVDLETYAPGTRGFLACDVDGDGEVTSSDARRILRAAVGLEELGPEVNVPDAVEGEIKNALLVDQLVIIGYTVTDSVDLTVEVTDGDLILASDSITVSPPENNGKEQKLSFDFDAVVFDDDVLIKAYFKDPSGQTVGDVQTYKAGDIRADFTLDEAQQIIDTTLSSMEAFGKEQHMELVGAQVRVVLAAKMLHELEQEKLIKNISYYPESSTYYYDFYDLGSGIYTVNDTHSENTFSSGAASREYTTAAAIPAPQTPTAPQPQKSNAADKRVLFLASEHTTNSAKWIYTQAAQYETLGVSVTNNNHAGLEDFEHLSGYDLIYIIAHGNLYEKTGEPYIATREYYLYPDEETVKKYISDGSVFLSGGTQGGFCYCLTPRFFSKCYKNNGLNDAIVLLTCCRSAGYIRSDNALLRAFYRVGASYVIGALNDSFDVYTHPFYERFIDRLFDGRTCDQAYNDALTTVGKNENQFVTRYYKPYHEEYPTSLIPYGNGKKTLYGDITNYATYVCSYVDPATEEGVGYVGAKFINNDQDSIFYPAAGNENGRVSIDLPAGTYTVIVYSDTERYQLKTYTVTLSGSGLTEKEPIKLEERICRVYTSVFPKDSDVAMENVTVSFYNDAIDPNTPVAQLTTKTAADGTESYADLLYRDYRVVCSHEAFGEYTDHLSINVKTVDAGGETICYYYRPIIDIDSFTVTGSVVDGETKKPLPEVLITLTTEGGRKYYGKTYADGTFDALIPAGNYDLEFSLDGYEKKERSVTVANNMSLGVIELSEISSVGTTYPYSGAVRKADDKPLGDADVTATNRATGISQTQKTDSLGKFVLALIPGEYDIEVTKTGFDSAVVRQVVITDAAEIETFPFYLGLLSNKEQDGLCGDDISWHLYENGTIVFSGTGTLTIPSDLRYELRTYVKKAIINPGITGIGAASFDRFYLLKSVSIPSGVISVGSSAFSCCYSLTGLTLPDSVTSIGERAFEGCCVLTSFTIPGSVIFIDERAFEFCCRLTSITIPSSVTSIEAGAFTSCHKLAGITVEPENPAYHSDGNCLIHTNTKTLAVGCKTSVIPADGSVTSIGESAFEGCRELKAISLPDCLTSIGNRSFMSTGLTGIRIPGRVVSIGNVAFDYCAGITQLTIPSSVKQIGKIAFGDCTGLESISVAPGNPVYRSAGNCLIETATKTLVLGCKTSVIPKDGSVTSIGIYAFYGCTGLTRITIPNGIVSIGGAAFYRCSNLREVIIPNSVTSIGEIAFYCCESLPSITIPDGVTFMDNRVFEGCGELTRVTLPASLTSVGMNIFDICERLTDIYFRGTKEQWDELDHYLGYDPDKTKVHFG